MCLLLAIEHVDGLPCQSIVSINWKYSNRDAVMENENRELKENSYRPIRSFYKC